MVNPAAPNLAARTAAAGRAVTAWRRLTGGTRRSVAAAERRTLVACSGGADSSALLLALAATDQVVVGHVVHDLRGRKDAEADRDAVLELARRAGLACDVAEISPRTAGGNAEAAARRLRYAALAEMAAGHGCRFVAAAHHADDELETILMGLMRGAGPRGLGGVAERRRLRPGVTLIRPMLDLTRDECREICRAAGVEWREDETNRDTSHLRAAVRHGVAPRLEAVRPGAAARAARSARLLRDAAGMVHDRAAELWATGPRWERGALRREREIVLGELVRVAARRLRGGRGLDRMSARGLGGIARAIGDGVTDPREFTIGGLRVLVTARSVEIATRSDLD